MTGMKDLEPVFDHSHPEEGGVEWYPPEPPTACADCGEPVLQGTDLCPYCWCFERAMQPPTNPCEIASHLAERSGIHIDEALDIAWKASWAAMEVRVSDIEYSLKRVREVLE